MRRHRLNIAAASAAGILTAAPALACELHNVSPDTTLRCMIDAAAPGDTILVEEGIYHGPLVITKPVTLIGLGRPMLIGGPDGGDIITIAADGVRISGFLIEGTGDSLERENCAIRVMEGHATIDDNILNDVLFGIDLKEAPGCVIEDNYIGGKDLDVARRGDGIRLFRSDNTRIEHNLVLDGRDSILWYSSGVEVLRNEARGCRYGFHLMFSSGVTLSDNRLTSNSVGIYVMYSKDLTVTGNTLSLNRGPSGYGLGLKETDDYTVSGNSISGNRVGVYVDGSPFTEPGPADFVANEFTANDIGMLMLPSVKGNRVHGNSFIDNAEQISVAGRGSLDANEFDIDHRGNYWSDYGGYDADNDGVGESEYESRTLFESLTDRKPELRLFRHSPVEQAVEFVARAVPAVRPEPKFVDWYPLTERPVAGVRQDELAQRGRLTQAASSLGVAVGGVAVLAAVPVSLPRRVRRVILTLRGVA